MARFAIFLLSIILSYSHADDTSSSDKLEQWKLERQEVMHKQRRTEEDRRNVVKKEAGVLRKLQQLEAELAENERQLIQWKNELRSEKIKVSQLKSELQKLTHQQRHYQKLFADRIRAIYKLGYHRQQGYELTLLLNVKNFEELMRKYRYVNSIAMADWQLLELLSSKHAVLQKTHAQLSDGLKNIRATTLEIKAKRSNIIAQQRHRQKLLRRYRTQRETYNHTLEELRIAVEELNKLLGNSLEENIADQAEEIRGLKVTQRGRILWPVNGRIVRNQNPHDRGITIKAEHGSDVISVADGVVARTVESVVGYGNTLLIAHGNGYISVYTHLSEIQLSEGQKVVRNQKIGKVGDTGSLIGSGLYFELWHDYMKLDTNRWLKNVGQ